MAWGDDQPNSEHVEESLSLRAMAGGDDEPNSEHVEESLSLRAMAAGVKWIRLMVGSRFESLWLLFVALDYSFELRNLRMVCVD